MFSIQSRFFEPTRPCTRDEFWKVVSNPHVSATIDEARRRLAAGDKKGYDAKKRSLPLFIFMSEIMPNTSPDSKGNPRPEARWRVQEAARLNGLVMVDFDVKDNPQLTNPRQYWEDFIRDHGHFLDETSLGTTILFAHETPGHGLHLVATAEQRTGNLYDNATALARIIGLKSDDSCKDASRGSFACKKEDIYYINEKIFSYDDEAYDKKFGGLYRSGGSRAVNSGQQRTNTEARENPCKSAAESTSVPSFHGTPMDKITQAWILEYPKVETRHGKMLEAAADLRYLVESPEELVVALMTLDCCKQIRDERGMREIEDAAQTAWTGPRYKNIPKRVMKVLVRAGYEDGVKENGKKDNSSELSGEELSALQTFAWRIRPLLAPPYDVVCEGVGDINLLAHVFAAGTMFDTLLTRCDYVHYDGEIHRMNPQALVIAPPASGKSGVDRLNKQVMAVLRAKDQISRDALKEYKRKRKERATSSKEQKQAALVEPQGMIRVLLSNTSNNQFYKRLINAREEIDNELWWLHVYMFDSELASANKANGGADWIGKRDMELKAFENEDAGSDYANEDSVNDFIPVHWNMVTTGTKVALAKKFTLANINDGLATRVAITPMDPQRYKMIARGDRVRNIDKETKLKQWGYWFDRQRGRLPVDRLVDHAYELCEQSSFEAEASSDTVLDTLRRRAVFYAEWFTIPRIVARLRREDWGAEPFDKIVVTDDDLQWATVMYDAVIYWQDYFFGQMLQESWENANRIFVPRQRTSRNAELYSQLPDEFTNEIAVKVVGSSRQAIKMLLSRWVKAGYIQRVKQGQYKKIMKVIV